MNISCLKKMQNSRKKHASEKIHVISFSDNDKLKQLIPSNNLKIYVNENTNVGSIIGSIEKNEITKQAYLYKQITDSSRDENKRNMFYVDLLSGDIYLLKKLNSVVESTYEIKVMFHITI